MRQERLICLWLVLMTAQVNRPRLQLLCLVMHCRHACVRVERITRDQVGGVWRTSRCASTGGGMLLVEYLGLNSGVAVCGLVLLRNGGWY